MDRSIIENPINSLGGINLSSSSPFQSPFLQIDPSVIRPPQIASEFIFPDGGTKSNRGRFELAFSQIGGSIMTGAAIGVAMGTFNGFREVIKMDKPLAIKRTHLLNFITRNGASMGNTFGTISLIYSTIGVGISFIQDDNDDLSTMLAATSTGALYGAFSNSKSMENIQGSLLTKMRLKRAGFGFAFGLLAASTLIFLFNQDKYSQKFNFNK